MIVPNRVLYTSYLFFIYLRRFSFKIEEEYLKFRKVGIKVRVDRKISVERGRSDQTSMIRVIHERTRDESEGEFIFREG